MKRVGRKEEADSPFTFQAVCILLQLSREGPSLAADLGESLAAGQSSL